MRSEGAPQVVALGLGLGLFRLYIPLIEQFVL